MKQSHFRLYQSLFENETYVTQTTEMQKVLHYLLISEYGIAKYNLNPNNEFSRTHYWLAAALSVERRWISERVNQLKEMKLIEYQHGFYKKYDTVPSKFRAIKYGEDMDEPFAMIDRFTFEFMLFDLLANKVFKHAHIVVYCACKLYENFGEVKTKKLLKASGIGRSDRLAPIMDDLSFYGLVDSERKHGKYVINEVKTRGHHRGNQKELRDLTKLRGDKLKNKEEPKKDFDNEIAQTQEEVIQLFKHCHRKHFKVNPEVEQHRKQLFKMNCSFIYLDEKIREYYKQPDTIRKDRAFLNFVSVILKEKFAVNT